MRARPFLLLGAAALFAGWRARRVGGPDDSEQPTLRTAAGRPRFVVPAGGTAPHGSPTSRGAEDELALRAGRTTIGRNARADVRLHEATVSLWHAEVDVTAAGVVRIRDLGAQNGVRVDGRPVADAELSDGNRVELGEVVLVFKSDLALGAPGRQGGELD